MWRSGRSYSGEDRGREWLVVPWRAPCGGSGSRALAHDMQFGVMWVYRYDRESASRAAMGRRGVVGVASVDDSPGDLNRIQNLNQVKLPRI
jgi:hypothetical protein